METIETKLLKSHDDFKLLLSERIVQGEELLKIDISNRDIFNDLKQNFNFWNDYNIEFLKQSFNKIKNEYRSSYEKAGIYKSFLNPSLKRDDIFEFKELFLDKISNLRMLLEKAELIKVENSNIYQQTNDKMEKNNEIFIVHGQDDAVKYEVSRFIGQLGLKPIILHEQSNNGNTIIEKIEKHTNVGFGIVLYTPCDLGAKKGEESKLNPRARQNVVFEHGYLIAKIGRNNVAALVKGEVEKPNDISGIVYISMQSDWKIQLIKDLKSSGYSLNTNEIF
ncbi:TIR domain-containing protein [Chryseobacterium gleum]|uniref:TIR domain-containing protein n=1 Tax=Chryseobacterium gleum TaxID=250 RepID=UPI001E622B56|nr:nucleotide-binding protein [Chryseobacterium gleum]MCD9616661.1 nucleotide-binding protein [Chryseobacterium gleum]